MTHQEIKLECLKLTKGDINDAEMLYQWVIESLPGDAFAHGLAMAGAGLALGSLNELAKKTFKPITVAVDGEELEGYIQNKENRGKPIVVESLVEIGEFGEGPNRGKKAVLNTKTQMVYVAEEIDPRNSGYASNGNPNRQPPHLQDEA